MTRPAEVTTGGYVCDATDRTQALRIDQHGGKNLRPWSMTLRALTHTREAAQATALRLRCDAMTGHNETHTAGVESGRTIAWFSCGIASTVAAKLALASNPATIVAYCDLLSSEHPDNRRFLVDAEKYLKTTIRILRSEKYDDVDDVILKRRYMAGVSGAPCTTELKKRPRFAFQRPDDVHVFGFTVEERERAQRLIDNDPGVSFEFPLIEQQLTKADCRAALAAAGVDEPAMYALGYTNNNCLGCVKATSATYWNRIRRDFPDVFVRRANQSRELGVKLTRVRGQRVYLDELPADYMPAETETITCGMDCVQPSLFGTNG